MSEPQGVYGTESMEEARLRKEAEIAENNFKSLLRGKGWRQIGEELYITDDQQTAVIAYEGGSKLLPLGVGSTSSPRDFVRHLLERF